MSGSNFIQDLSRVLATHAGRRAFCIGKSFYSYREFAVAIARISRLLEDNRAGDHVGIWLTDHLESYAAILALWFSSRAFVPLNPFFPDDRNRDIAQQMKLRLVLWAGDREPGARLPGYKCLYTGRKLSGDREEEPYREAGSNVRPASFDPARTAYVLFTSGSTGKPKGVKISFGNLNAFITAFLNYPGIAFGPEDRALQINDMSYDGAISSWLPALMTGACVYTVPPGEIKYLAAYKLMVEHRLTYIKMPPSTLSFLRPYFSDIRLPAVRYCMFGGEALPAGLLEEFEPCVPNAVIKNLYGPTESTIFCSVYDWNDPVRGRKSLDGTVSIGRPFGRCILEVRSLSGGSVGKGEPGELWIGGPQVSAGYWQQDELTDALFVDGFYRSGDRVLMDEEGDLMFLGREDMQVQIQGFRVELGEIETRARDFLGGNQVLAYDRKASAGGSEICLVVELGDQDDAGWETRRSELRQFLNGALPAYMLPSEITGLKAFPRLISGKTDRNGVIKIFEG